MGPAESIKVNYISAAVAACGLLLESNKSITTSGMPTNLHFTLKFHLVAITLQIGNVSFRNSLGALMHFETSRST